MCQFEVLSAVMAAVQEAAQMVHQREVTVAAVEMAEVGVVTVKT